MSQVHNEDNEMCQCATCVGSEFEEFRRLNALMQWDRATDEALHRTMRKARARARDPRADNQLCERSMSPCAPALLTQESIELPDHVCAPVLERTLERYSTDVVEPWNGAQVMWSLEWPLPAGHDRIALFAEANQLQRTHLPYCLVSVDPMATIGLVVQRRSEHGLVQLLGRMTDTGDDGDALLDHVLFAEPLLQIERTLRPSTQMDALQTTSQELWDWYTTTLLGKPVYGRPRASGYWSSREDFLRDSSAAYAVLRRTPHTSGRSQPIQMELATELGIHVGTLKEYLKRYGLTWSDLIKELEKKRATDADRALG